VSESTNKNMSIDWPSLCLSAKETSIDDRILAVRSSFGTLSGLLLLITAISALLCARFYLIPLSKRVLGDGRAVVWPLYAERLTRIAHIRNSLLRYGPFMAMSVCFSLLGAVTYLCSMFAETAVAIAGDPSVHSPTNPTSLNRTLNTLVDMRVFTLFATFDIFYPLDFLFVTNVKLLVIHRFYSVALYTNPALRSLRFSSSVFKATACFINAGNIAGIALRCFSAHSMIEASSFAAAAVAVPLENQIILVSSMLRSVDDSKTFAYYQLALEAAVLTTMALVHIPVAFMAEIWWFIH
jgi:hypothetical protein